MSRIGSRAAVGLVFAAAAATLLAQRSIEEQLPPKPARYVTDNAGALPADRAEALNSKLEQFERCAFSPPNYAINEARLRRTYEALVHFASRQSEHAIVLS